MRKPPKVLYHFVVKPKKDLRQTCLDMYGEDFVRRYDMMKMGIPVGNVEETKEFLAKVEAAKKEVQE